MQRIVRAAVLLALVTLGSDAFGQSIKHPFPFHLPPRDTSVSNYLPQIETPAGKHGALSLSPEGHIRAKDGTRLRFFGTELNYNANFMQHNDARTIAKRLSKLGFNAVRLVADDWWGWDDASFFTIYDSTGAANYNSSYRLNPLQVARFDSLLYEFKQAGIYAVLTLSAYHQFGYGEGVTRPDSLNNYYLFLRYLEPSARELERKWVATLLNHKNPLTGLSYADDPSIAVAEIAWQNPLFYYWTYDLLNFIDPNNTQGLGKNTVNYYMSKRFDTLFTTFLKNKYGNNAQLNAAWMGTPSPVLSNLMDNGSFEDASRAWSFGAQNSANATFVDADGGVDSTTYKKIRIAALAPMPMYQDIFASNISANCGRDSLYEVTFWAKMGYDAKRPGSVMRKVYLYVSSISNYQSNLGTYVTIDTGWKKYSYSFRATQPGLQSVAMYVGGELGDVWLDAFSLKHKNEVGLVFGESLDNYSIYRLKQSQLAGFPLQRMRDEVNFYDSLQLSYYLPIQKLIKDTLHFSGLVNFTQLNYWHTLPDQYVSSFGDLTEGYVGWDYMQARPNVAYDSSHWMIGNGSELKSTYAGNLGYYMPSASALGKAFFANVSVPIPNQQSAEQMLLLPAYASFQDWDGIFYTPFVSYRSELFQDSIPTPFDKVTAANVNSIEPNTAMLALAPQASAVFRNGYIAPAEVAQTVEHTTDEVSLWPYVISGRGPWGVEGYLDPNAFTALQLRQKFNGIHKVAAQYAYIGDTSTKISDNNKVVWDQTNGLLNVNQPKFNGVAGRYGRDTIVLSKLRLSRMDDTRDMFVLTYLSLDALPLDSSLHSLLSVSTRSQNTGLVWPDSVGYGAYWGRSPMLMSVATVDLSFKSIKDSVLIYPLDSMGFRVGNVIVAKQDKASGLFKAMIDQSIEHSVWFDVEKKNRTSGVQTEIAANLSALLSPNPATNTTKLMLTLTKSEQVKIQVVDDLGRSVREVAFAGQMGQRVVDLSTSDLAAGHYVVRIQTGNRSLALSLNVIR
jgi:hypothetical protein